MLTVILFLSVAFVAFTNGANANFKGVASLYASGTTTLRGALYWGTAMTFVGSLAAMFFARELLKSFSGQGLLVNNDLVRNPEFLAAVALGAALTSFLATRLGFPVSTTHALVGALIGSALAGGGEVKLAALGTKFFLPLVLGPLVASILGMMLYGFMKLCRCAPQQRTRTLDVLHYLSAGGASFARGMNDTPKMAALLMVFSDLDIRWAFLGVGVVIAMGGLLDADKVAETLGKKVTQLDPSQGFAASLVTASLVTLGSARGLPLSTTHVSVGSLIGIGAITGQAHWRKVGEILLAWVTTVPCGALLAAIAYAVLATVF